MIHLSYWDTKPHIFQQKGVFVSFPFLRESNEPLETHECATVNYFNLIKRQQMNNLTIISNKQ